MSATTQVGRTTRLASPTLLEGLAQTRTLAWRTLVQIRHNPWELGDFSFQPIMFVLLFTYVFGGAISGSTGEYLTFALPGIIVMNMLFVTMYVGMGLNTDLTKGVFDRLRSLPIARWAPMAGRITADLVKQAWSILLLLGIGLLLGFRVGTSWLYLLGAFLLVSSSRWPSRGYRCSSGSSRRIRNRCSCSGSPPCFRSPSSPMSSCPRRRCRDGYRASWRPTP